MIRLPEVFKHKDFVRLLTARALSSFSLTMLAVAIGWQVYVLARRSMSIEQSAFLVGLVGLVQFVPMVLLALPGGQMADRYNRKHIFTACLVMEVVIALALLGSGFLPAAAQLPSLFAIAAFFGVMRAFQPAAGTAMLPMLVPRQDLPKCIAWNGMVFQLGMALGPAIAGVLMLWSAGAIYASAAVALTMSAINSARIEIDTTPKAATMRAFAMAMEGLRFVWGNKILLGAISLDLVVVLLAGATALLPAFAYDILKTGPVGLGLLRAAPAIGALLAGAYLTRKPLTRRLGRWMLRSIVVFGMGTIAFSLSHSLALSFAALCLTGAADTISVFVRHSMVQTLTPDAMRGRVGAVSMLFISASNELGEFESGVAARFLGPVNAVLIGGIGAMITGFGWGRLFPALQDSDRLEFAEAEPQGPAAP